MKVSCQGVENENASYRMDCPNQMMLALKISKQEEQSKVPLQVFLSCWPLGLLKIVMHKMVSELMHEDPFPGKLLYLNDSGV